MSPSPVPAGVEWPEQTYHVGQVVQVRPAVKRSSRRVAFKGYTISVVRKLGESGKPIEIEHVFKPTYQYDPSVLSTNRYQPSYLSKGEPCDTPQKSSEPTATPNTASTLEATTTTPPSSPE